MRLIIDIPERIYETIEDDIVISRGQLLVLQKHILDGTPIPDNATVCDIEQIRAEIEDKRNVAGHFDTKTARAQVLALSWVLDLIDKYAKGESE